MAGTISSLGIGSGVLTSDVLDQLREADEAALVTPIETEIGLNEQSVQALELLNNLLSSFRSSVRALDNDALYQERTVSGNNDSVSVTADAGVSVQDISISDTQLARKNVLESGAFTSTDDAVASGGGTMTLSIGTKDYEIDYTGMSLYELKEAINETTGGAIVPSILQVGENDYRLILTSGETGADQAITVSDSVGGTLNSQLLAYDETTNPDGMQEIQEALDASFKYNGITITRSSNSIDDLVIGLTIDLLEDDGSANISIEQDTATIESEMSMLVENYNSLMSELSDMTLADVDAGTIGIFNGDNSISRIGREITRMLTSISDEGYSLGQFGIDLSQDGVMSFSATDFRAKMKEDSAAMEAFLSGTSTISASGNLTETDGIFTTLSDLMDSYAGYNGQVQTMLTAAEEKGDALLEERERAIEILDARYETMAARFTAYDAIISKLNNQFSVLDQMIQAELNAD